jgi:branched-chain amino acid transport system substrate-binding protein
MEKAAALAIDEINTAGGLGNRQFGLVVCDTESTSEGAIAATKHLVEALRVQAVIGPASSGETIDLFNGYAKEAGVLIVSPSATSTAITDLPDGGLVWRTAPSDAIQGVALSAYFADVGFGKVAIVYRNDVYGSTLKDAILEDYCLPVGKAKCLEEGLLVLAYESDDTLQQKQKADQTQAVQALDQFQPDAVVLIGFAVDGISFMNLASEEEHGHTRFVLTDGVKDVKLLDGLGESDLGPGVEPIVLGPDVLCPIVGTNPATPESDVYKAFELNYKAKWNLPPEVFTANTYDAAYLIAYAWAAASRTTSVPSAKDLAEAMKLMSDEGGTVVKAGLGDWNTGLKRLVEDGAAIDFRGASGELQFDPKTGEAPSSIEAWRVDLTKEGGKGRIVSMGVMLTEDGHYTPPLFDEATWTDTVCKPVLDEHGFFVGE